MNRKIILALLVMVLAAVSIAAVSATEDTVTVNGLEFNVPDGFEKVNSTSTSAKFSGDEGNFTISVENSYNIMILNPKTINGKEGTLETSADTPGKVRFQYPEINQIVTITVSDESLLESIIPES